MDTLVSAVGRARAKELVYSARVVKADEAKVFCPYYSLLGDRTEKTNNET